jgi:YVTN family beta-propeller protein
MIKRAVAAVAGLGLVLSVAGCVSTGHASSLAHRMAVHPPRGPFTVYVLNQGSGTVTPISTATNTAGKPIKVGHSPCSMAIAPDGRAVYVTNQMAATVTPINTRTNRSGEPIKVGFMASMIVFTPDGKTAYVGTANSVVPFNTVTGAVGRAIRVAPCGDMGAITAMTTTPDGKTVYVATWLGTVIPVSTRTRRARKAARP